LGKEVGNFEKLFREFCDADHAVGVASGLDAIEVGLRVLDIQRGDFVLTTPLTAFATTLAIIRAGGRPVYAGTDEPGVIDLLECDTILSARAAIKFFVPVHLYGQCLDQKKLSILKERFALKIVEDAAQAHGASNRGSPVGTVGDVTAY